MYIMKEELKNKLIKYIESLGVRVYTHTDARGNQGYFSGNIIEISYKIKEERFIPTLLHEFSHYIHTKVETNATTTGGDIRLIFNLNKEKEAEIIQNELIKITNWIDENSLCKIFKSYKNELEAEIEKLVSAIQEVYPDFKKTKNISEFENSTVSSLKSSKMLAYYTQLKKTQREKKRICRNINKFRKYYATPAELFARFIEGLYIDSKKVYELASTTCKRFFALLEKNYYLELRNVLSIAEAKK